MKVFNITSGGDFMKRLGIDYLNPGMKIAKSIYRADGQIALGKEVELTEEYIKKLPTQGITSVYIMDDRLLDVKVNDVISDEMRIEALKLTKEINDELSYLYKKIKEGADRNSKINESLENIHNKLDKLGNDIVDDFLRTKNPMLQLIDTRYNEDYIYSHMVNVAVLAIMIGKSLGYKEEKLVHLAKGCLVIDIGIILGVPKEIREKPDKLTEEEMSVIKKHPKVGYEFLKKLRELNILSAHVSYQHHERYNGKGYPRGLEKSEITEYGYVAGLADVYDAITNNKNYKMRVLPGKAREFLMVARDNFFPAYIIDKFLEKIPVYPNGTTVLLSGHKEGVVVKQNRDALGLPIVRILKENDVELTDGYDINLQDEISMVIEKILD